MANRNRQVFVGAVFDLFRVERNPKKCYQVFEALRVADVSVNLGYTPMYLQSCYRCLGFKLKYSAESEQYYAEAISLPMYPIAAPIRLRYKTSGKILMVCVKSVSNTIPLRYKLSVHGQNTVTSALEGALK
jgi:hypothetical protein